MSEFRISIPASVCVSIVAANEAAALAKVKEMSQADDGCDLPWDGSMGARLYLDGDGFSVENEQEIVCDRCDQIAVATVQTRIGEQHLCEKCQTAATSECVLTKEGGVFHQPGCVHDFDDDDDDDAA